MSEVNPTAVENTDSVEFESVILETDLLPNNPVEITSIVTHLDIFENLEKPYLTASLAVGDSEDILSSLSISGGEKIHITLKSTRLDTKSVSKTFYIDKVIASNKTSESAEFFVFHLLEDIAYQSTLQNVNKSYSGEPAKILRKISTEFFKDKEIESTVAAQKIKVIVPNLTPIETMTWIRNRSCTSNGYPFYLVSTLVGDKLSFVDLETLLNEDAVNDVPFTYGISLKDNTDHIDTSNRRVILDYKMGDTENLISLIRKGLVGAEYKFLNPTDNEENTFQFDVQKDVVEPMAKSFPKINESPPFTDKFNLRGTPFNKYNSRIIAQVGTTEPYENDNSYLESKDPANYKLNVINRSIDNMIKKNPMSIVINGLDFLDGTSHHTVGRKIAIRFLRNVPAENTDYHFDNKKSGDFLIFSAKHSITNGDYVLALTCVKLDNGDVE